MDSTASSFRESKLNLLRFLSNPEDQRRFAAEVGYDDYSAEFYCWWFDDFYPDSDLFVRAFSPQEIEILQTFSSEYEAADAALGERDRTIEELQLAPEWRRIVAVARKTLEVVCARAT